MAVMELVTTQSQANVPHRASEQVLFCSRTGGTRSLEIFRNPYGHVRGRVQELLEDLKSQVLQDKYSSELELSRRFEQYKDELRGDVSEIHCARENLLELACHTVSGPHVYVFIRAMDLLIRSLEEDSCTLEGVQSMIGIYRVFYDKMGMVALAVETPTMDILTAKRLTQAFDLLLKKLHIYRIKGLIADQCLKEEIEELRKLIDEERIPVSFGRDWEVKHNLRSIAEGVKFLSMDQRDFLAEYQKIENLTENWYLKTLSLWDSIHSVDEGMSFAACLRTIDKNHDSIEWDYEKIAFLRHVIKHTTAEDRAQEIAVSILLSYYRPEVWQSLSDEVKEKLVIVGEEFSRIGELQPLLKGIKRSEEYYRLERKVGITEQFVTLRDAKSYWKVRKTEQRGSVKPSICEYTSPTEAVTGRKTLLLKQIKQALRKSITGRSTAVVLTGQEPTESTLLATTFIEKHAHLYRLIWTFNAESRETLQESYRAFAQRLGIVQGEEVNAVEICTRVNEYLQTPEYHGWLLYFDNAEDPKELEALFPPYEGKILVTTRKIDKWEQSTLIPVDEFREEEAIELLEKLIPQNRRDRGFVRELATALENCPLALNLAGSFIKNDGGDLTTKSYLDDFWKRQQELGTRNNRSEDYSDTIATTWRITMDRIRKDFPDSAEILNICAYLNADGIPLVWLKNWLQEKRRISDDFELAEEFSKAIGTLRNFSLLREEVPLKTLRMHRLVQFVTQDELSVEEKKVFLEQARKLVSKEFEKDNKEEGLFHAISVTNHALALEEQGHLKADELQGIAALLHQIGKYLNGKGNASEAKRYFEEALRIKPAVCGDEGAIFTLIELGEVCHVLREHEQAKEHLQAVLAINPDNDDALWHLGNVLYDLNQFQEAKTYLEMALEYRKERYGDSHLSVVQTQNKLQMTKDLLPVRLSLTAEKKPTQDCGFPREGQSAPNTNSSQPEENETDTFIQVLFRHFARLFHPIGSWIDSMCMKVRNFFTIY